MSTLEKLKVIRESIFKMPLKEKELPGERTNAALATIDEDLDLLLDDDASLLSVSVSKDKRVLRLIIILDISGSMDGTEKDIEEGLKDIIRRFKGADILFNFVVFNGERHVIFDDTHISQVEIPSIYTNGSTNLNGSLYYTIKHKCQTGENLLVTISDGKDTVNELSADKVSKEMRSIKGANNHFYFLGEPTEEDTPEEVHARAVELGFSSDNISVFTREGNGNRLNFEVISDMISDLLIKGHISKTWSEPIKEHYLKLTDRRRK